MTDSGTPDGSVEHDTFTLEKRYVSSPAAVFAAWSDPAAKKRWFAGPDADHRLDFRVGGTESSSGRVEEGGPLLGFESSYHDIVPERRIVFSSALLRDGVPVTVSITTVELAPDGEGTLLTLTQQATYLDGFEKPDWRRAGTESQLDALAGELPA